MIRAHNTLFNYMLTGDCQTIADSSVYLSTQADMLHLITLAPLIHYRHENAQLRLGPEVVKLNSL